MSRNTSTEKYHVQPLKSIPIIEEAKLVNANDITPVVCQIIKQASNLYHVLVTFNLFEIKYHIK
jgi:hypothetical protein